MQDHLRQWRYPCYRIWTIEALKRNAFVCRIQYNREPKGYMWLSNVPDSYRVLEMHICVDQAYHKQWFRRSLLEDLYQVVKLLDGRYVFIMHKNNRFTETLARLGWTAIPPFAYRRIL
mgnify:CR=1 FL=1